MGWKGNEERMEAWEFARFPVDNKMEYFFIIQTITANGICSPNHPHSFQSLHILSPILFPLSVNYQQHRLIIIYSMHSPALLNYHPQALNSLFPSDNPTKHYDSSQRSSLTRLPKRLSFEPQCKKEIHHFFVAIRKLAHRSASALNSAWKGIVVASLCSLRQGQQHQDWRCSLRRNNRDSISSPAIIVKQSLRTYHFLILVLTARASLLKSGEVMFDLELVSLQSKIVYKKANLKKWQQVHTEIESIKTTNARLVLMVENKGIIMGLLGKNMEFQSMMQRFMDLNDVNLKMLKEVLEENGWKDDQIRAQVVFQGLERYRYVKRAVRTIVEADERQDNGVSFQQMLAETVLYNITNKLELRVGQSVQKALSTQSPAIIKILEREYEHNSNRVNSSRRNNNHYPHQLDNAQNCWRCKLKRCYVSCSTCNQRQRRPIALCLNCYETHHIDLLNQQSTDSSVSYQQWREVDHSVESLMRWQNK